MATVILDHCTGSNGAALAGRTPDTTNTPGGTWSDSGSNWTVQTNKLQAGSGSVVLAAIEAGSGNVTVSALININTSGAGIVCRYVDDNNFILAIINPGSPGTLTLFKRVAGTFTQLASLASGFVVNTGSDYTLTLSADAANLLTATISAAGAVPITATDSAGSTNTKCGFYANTYTSSTWDDFQVDTVSAAGTITITTPVTGQAYQRNGSSQASIPITGTYTGSPTAIEASFNGGAYATIVASPSAGSYSGTLSNQAAGQGTLTVRWTNDTAVTATKTFIAITDVFVLAGDSRADGRLTNAQTYTGTGRVYSWRQDDAWFNGDAADTGATNGTFVPLIANLYSAKFSRPPAFITCGTGSTDVAGSSNEWVKGNSAYTEMASQIAGAGTSGVKAGIFFLGPNAIYNGSGAILAKATYNAALDTLASNFAADFTTTASSNPKIFVDVCGESHSVTNPNDQRGSCDHIRAGVIEAWGDNAAIPGGPVLIDQDYADDVHPSTDAQGLVVAKRYWCAIEDALFSGTYSRGPRVTGSLTLDTARTLITITFDRDLNTAGNSYGGFRVTDSGTPATIVGAQRASARRVVVEVSAALSAVGNVAVSFASSDDAAGQTVPLSATLTLPDSTTTTLPAEPFYAAAVVAEGTGGGALKQLGGMTGGTQRS